MRNRIRGKEKEWDATIIDLTPNKRIAWESEDGDYIAGIVTFEPVGTNRTRINLKLFYDNKGSARDEEEFLSSIGHRVEQDLQIFQRLMEDQHLIDNGAEEFGNDLYGLKSPKQSVLHRPDPGPGPGPEPDPPQPPPRPFPKPPIPPEPPV